MHLGHLKLPRQKGGGGEPTHHTNELSGINTIQDPDSRGRMGGKTPHPENPLEMHHHDLKTINTDSCSHKILL